MGNIESNASDNYLRYLNQSPVISMYIAPTNHNEVMNDVKSLKSKTPGFD